MVKVLILIFMLLAHVAGVEHQIPTYTPASAPALESDYKEWTTALLPKHFRGVDQFAPHHEDFWRWVWQVERGEQPKPPAFLLVWNRGGAKSTQAEGAVTALGARRKRKYVLYIGRKQALADAHVKTIASMITSSRVAEVYPDFANPEVKFVGNRRVQSAWNHERLTTASGFTVASFGIDSALRGVRIEEFRPDVIVLDDIDDVNDSVGVVDNLVAQIGSSVLPTASPDCIYLFPQNVIHRDSVMNRILTRKCGLLGDRVESGPVPAVYNPVYEHRHERWHITGGEVSWVGMPIEECESKLNAWDKKFWDREAQHDVEQPYEDAIYSMFDPVFHVITWSEFARGMARLKVDAYDRSGSPRLPERGHIVMAQDWGNNHAHPCANRWAWKPAEEMALKDSVFYYRERTWPRFPKRENDDRLHPSALKLGKFIQELEDRTDEARRVKWRLASHERPEIVVAYDHDMREAGMKPLSFEQIDTSEAKEGILHMQSFLSIIEDELHPFRVYPEGHPQAGEPLRGRPRLYYIVADGQGELYWDARTSTLKVKEALDEDGQARTRYEIVRYRKPDTAQGAETARPPKRDDDMQDCDRAVAGRLFPTVQKLTDEERREFLIPERFRLAQVEKLPQEEQAAGIAGHYYETFKAEAKLRAKQGKGFREKIKQKYGLNRVKRRV